MTLFYIKLYLLALVAFLGIDFVWLTFIASSFYRSQIGHLMADKPDLAPAGVFYPLNALGILLLVVFPALNKNSLTSAAAFGALYGLITYGTYDLTNHAILKNWPLKMTLVDMAWGVALSSAVATISYLVGSKIRS